MTLLPKKPTTWTVDPAKVDPRWASFWRALVYGVPVFNGNAPFDFAGRKLLTRSTSTIARGVSDVGGCSEGFATATVTTTMPSTLAGASRFTVLLVCSATSNTGTVALSIHTGASPALLFFPFDDNLGDGVRIFWDGVDIINENGVDRADGKMHAFAFVNHSATDHRQYVDGKLIATSSTSKIIGASSDLITFGSVLNILFFHGKIALAAILSEPMAPAEVAAWSADPWGPWRLERRYPAPTRRGAAGRRIINVVRGNKYRLRRRLTRGDKTVVSTPGGAGIAASLRENP